MIRKRWIFTDSTKTINQMKVSATLWNYFRAELGMRSKTSKKGWLSKKMAHLSTCSMSSRRWCSIMPIQIISCHLENRPWWGIRWVLDHKINHNISNINITQVCRHKIIKALIPIFRTELSSRLNMFFLQVQVAVIHTRGSRHNSKINLKHWKTYRQFSTNNSLSFQH